MSGTWELKRLTAKHKCILDLHLAGLSHIDVAKEMKMTEQAIGMICRSPLFQDELARRRSGLDKKVDEASANTVSLAKKIMEEAAADAAQLHVELLMHEDPRVAQASANRILEETFGGEKKVAASVVNINIEQLAVLQQALAESR